jgi:diguanylate cyclase (GGDEF)-like protein
VTLRARLTATFLAVVVGPVLLGAVFVGITVTALSRERAQERLAVAADAVRAEIGARCDRLATAARSAALLTAAGRPPTGPVDAGLATSVVVADPQGRVQAVAGPPVPAAFADCAGTSPAAPTAFGVRVERRDGGGELLGYAVATAPADEALAQALGRVSGASVRLGGDAADGRYVSRMAPAPNQPLRLALAVDPQPAGGLYALLMLVVGGAGLVAVAAAWWLARSTTRPLAELAHAAARVAAGDLGVQVTPRGNDEVGTLGRTFNRMTYEMRGYVRALTASRDQLRGYLSLLGHTLSGTHDLGRILSVTLHTARAATSARSGVVMLYDPTTKMLVAQCAVGSGPAGAVGSGPIDLGGLRLKLGEGLLGAVAESGSPLHGRVTGETPLAPQEPRAVTYVAVPFAAPEVAGLDGRSGEESARGVLALYDRVGPDEFDAADVATLTTFAAQAAIALDNVRLHEEAQRLSLTDPLTGLFNYRYLRESLRREMERAARFGRTLAVLALDLDHFKEVNDRYGHGAGDVVLVEVARRIRGIIREVDFAFRRGGEEFVILLPETDAAGGAALARRLGEVVRRSPVSTGDHAISLTVSTGIAVYPDHGATGSAVLEAADKALYAAKAAGRNRAVSAPASAPVTAPASAPVTAPASAPVTAPGASWGTQPARSGRGG